MPSQKFIINSENLVKIRPIGFLVRSKTHLCPLPLSTEHFQSKLRLQNPPGKIVVVEKDLVLLNPRSKSLSVLTRTSHQLRHSIFPCLIITQPLISADTWVRDGKTMKIFTLLESSIQGLVTISQQD